jgi:hypothetical protein
MAELDPIATGALSEQSGSTLNLDRASREQREEETQRADFEDLARRAIGVAVDRPNSESAISRSRSELVGGSDGPVGSLKNDLISDVAREGTTSASGADESTSAEEALEDRVKTLYFELTDYQVAWRIAQKIPQDLTQILRGN